MKEEKQGGLLSGILALSVAGILVKVCGFFYKVPLNALLGDEMANVNAAYAVYSVLYTLSTAGIPSGIAVLSAEAAVRKEGKGGILRPARSMLAWVGGIGSILLLLFAYPISLWNSGGDTYYALLAIAPGLFFVCISSVYRGGFQGEGRMAPIAVSELLEALGKMGLGLLLAHLAIGPLGLSPRLSAALSVFGITAGLGGGVLFLSLRGRRMLREGGSPVSRRMLLKLSLPIMLSSLMLNLTSLVDSQCMRPLLTGFYGDAARAKAVYSDYSTGALTLFNLPTVLIYPITCAAIPLISGAIARKGRGRGERHIEAAFRMAALVSLPAAVILGILGSPILELLFRGDGDMAENAGPLLALLAPSVFVSALFSVSCAVLQACRLQQKPVASVFFGLLVKVAFSFLLIPRIGPLGAPLGTLLFFLTVTVGNFYWILKETGFVPRVGKMLLRPFFAAALCGGAAALLFGWFHPALGILALLPALLLAGLLYPALVLLFGCVSEEDLSLLPGGKRLVRLVERLRGRKHSATAP